jgi:hypothetical protein
MITLPFLFVRYCAFVPSNPKRDDFVGYANSALRKKGTGGLVCSLSEHMFKTVLVKKINKFLESDRYESRISTTCIGKTTCENRNVQDVFVLSDEVCIMLFISFKDVIENRKCA